jgi:hypothetical protein
MSCDDAGRTPFTRAFNLFKSALDHEGADGVVSTNLVRCAFYDRNRPTERSLLKASLDEQRQVLDWQRGCLTEEVKALDPTAVVFLTGPYYDKYVREEFSGVEFEPFGDYDLRQRARVHHRSLPQTGSFRTYHPGALSRMKRWSWLDELVHQVAGEVRDADN